MAVKIQTEYSAYDKVKKYKGKEFRYISKRKFKSLGLKKEAVRGFFSVRKAKTEQAIVCNGISFDLREKRKCRRMVGYVKGENGGFYAMTASSLLPFFFLLLFSLLPLFFLLSDIQTTAVNPFKSTVLPTGQCLRGKRNICRFYWKIRKTIPATSHFPSYFWTARFCMSQNKSRPGTASVP